MGANKNADTAGRNRCQGDLERAMDALCLRYRARLDDADRTSKQGPELFFRRPDGTIACLELDLSGRWPFRLSVATTVRVDPPSAKYPARDYSPVEPRNRGYFSDLANRKALDILDEILDESAVEVCCDRVKARAW